MTDSRSLERWATWREIHRQPEIWRSWAADLAREAGALRRWIAERGVEEVWLCGAGSSSFIGEIAAAGAGRPGPRLRAVPTTDYVAAPQDFPAPKGRLLVVQFSRSGDSSESVGMLDLLDQLLPEADRLHVTCNPEGTLATRAHPGPGELRLLLPPEAAHDQGFAMTSSVSCMLLGALAVFDPETDAARALPILAEGAEELLERLKDWAQPRPDRAFFLGSGALKFAARESALKVLELTAGRVNAAWDSPLGFRHGPKSAVEPDAQVYVLLHPDHRTARYDSDLAEEVARQYPEAEVRTIGTGGEIPAQGLGKARWDAVLHIIPAQMLAARWSDGLGLNVDDPFKGQGSLTRVVAGVKLYRFEP
ncbi:phosphosugar isomerase [Neomegalonema sp.]|uniref:phosphosugar isomerase n=1 Tax=Neomegalonema sp. TaxID=2039713 RepID=UPI0026049889|nr:phosphosugar isomerase [Neomegalonema sp.]MDD2869195.1 phosphosugar isomerase [Neomegalonema sp.]